MLTMYDHQGYAHQVPASSAAGAYNSGRLTFLKTQRVHVVAPDGTRGSVLGLDVGDALSKGYTRSP